MIIIIAYSFSLSNCQILFARPRAVDLFSLEDEKRDTVAKTAADMTTRIAEDLLSAGTLAFGQLHLYATTSFFLQRKSSLRSRKPLLALSRVSALFAALSIHAIVIRRGDSIQGQLAENRARQCMLAMSQLANSWPVAGWILRLFINLMKRLTGQSFGKSNNVGGGARCSNQGKGDTLDNDFPASSVGGLTSQHIPPNGSFLGGDQDATDQLLSDALWDADQDPFNLEFVPRAQPNGLFPWFDL